MASVEINIRRARPDEAAVLTELAHAAKRHWGYPENWIERWKDDLTITPEFIAANEVYVAVIDDAVAGCCALVQGPPAELEHMWIRPAHMGSGLGKALFLHVKNRARELNLSELELSADPNAEGFYERMGARRVGDVRSDIEGQPRILPRMTVETHGTLKKETPPGW